MKNYKEMTAEELKKELERIEDRIFEEKMADFMDWSVYYRLTAEKDAVKAELKARG